MAYRIKMKKNKILWPIIILRLTLPLFCFGFYGQIFLMFTTIFYCRKSESTTSPYLKCRPGHWFNNIKPIGGIALFLHFLISLITNTLYYKPIFIRCNSDVLKKSNSFPDIILLFTKMIIITVFILDKGNENEHWAILSFLVLVTGTNAYFSVFYKNRQNIILLTLNNFFSLFLFVGFLVLFFGKMFKFLQSDGLIFLLFSCALLIFLYIIFFKNDNMENISKDYKNINNPDEYLNYVKLFLNLIKNKNSSRNFSIDIKSLIFSIEENCIQKDCPLKKYLINLNKGFDYEYLLLQFCEKLFQYGISKFNGNIFLKNHYSLFLITEMYNKKKALIILESIKDGIFSLQTNYNIYTCKRIIEKYISPFINKNNFYFNYRVDIQEFKIYVEKISLLYYQFLSLLLESKMKKINNLEQINKLGHQIIKLKKMIEIVFVKLISTKTDNIEIIKLYSEYVQIILKDEEKNKKCQELKKIIFNNIINDINEKDYSNFNLYFLKENSNSQYLLISLKNKNFGNILDCSMNLSTLFGYQKNELIGKNINIFIPEIFQQKHNSLIYHKSEENKLKFLEGLYKNDIYSPDFIEKDIYCISKSKYLIPIKIKIYLVNDEDNELIYIAEISKNISLNKDLLKNNNKNSKYCILTDQNFLIQYFTPNCINNLKLNFEDVCSNFSIINYIKQFKNDYISVINQNSNIHKYSKIKTVDENNLENILPKNNLSNNKKQKIKNDLFNKKYSKKCKITWIPPKNTGSKIIKENINDLSITESNISKNNKYLNDIEITLYMEPTKIKIDNELLGYYFSFSKIYNIDKKYYLNYKIKNTDKEEKIKKTKKYQCIFKSLKIENKINKIINNLKNKSKRNSLEIMFSKVIKEEVNILDSDIDIKNHSKYSSTHEIIEVNNKDEEFIIDEDFIPQSDINFSFDIKNITYNFSNKLNNKEILDIQLKKEAEEKIKIYKNINLMSKNLNFTNSLESSKEEESYYESEVNSSELSKSISESYSNNSLSLKEKKNINDSINTKNEQKQSIINKKNNNEEYEKNINEKNNNNLSNNNFYKVNLNNIHFMKYDFNKEAIIEEKNKNKNISKIESVLMNLNKNVNNIGYPFITLINNKKLNKKENGKKDKDIKNYQEKKDVKNEYTILEKKINNIINNQKDEDSIKKLKKTSLISFIIILALGFANTYCSLNFFLTSKKIFNLVFISSYLRYCEGISIYYVRELSLLNFNLIGIKGGIYTKIPAKNRNKYISLIQSKLIEIFTENQSSMTKILSTTIKFSKNTENYIKMLNSTSNETSEDIFTLLIQYNSDLYYISSSSINLLNKNPSILYNYIYNNFYKYRSGLDLLINLYDKKYDNNKKKVKIIAIIILIIIILLFIIIYIYILKYFFEVNKKEINYINIFYGINSKILKNLMNESLKFFNKLKDSKDKNYLENEEISNNSENNFFITNSKKENISKNTNQEQNYIIEYNSYILFIIIFGIFLLILYFLLLYAWIYLFLLLNKANNLILFKNNFQRYQNQIIDIFNIYREYLFNDEIKILNYTSLEYLKILEDEIYDTITESNKKVDAFIENLIVITNKEILKDLDTNVCANYITDFYNSVEECTNKYINLFVFKFYYFSNYFLEEIKISKNLVRYNLENKKIKGDLNKADFSEIIEEYKKDININNNIEFRLNLFNNESIHSNLNLLFINNILPHLMSNRKVIFNYISLEGKDSFFIIIGISYLLLLIILFIGCFNLLIIFLNIRINKVKNILSIIPLNILISQNDKYIQDLFVDK